MTTPNTASAIVNRLKKNWDKLKPWADRFEIEAFRLYDRDIPEYPSIIEIYGKSAVLWDRRDAEIDSGKDQNFADTLYALELLGFREKSVVVKRRERQRPRGEFGDGEKPQGRQYTRTSNTPSAPHLRSPTELTVREGDHKFLVNLRDYLDTGLFLDHRLTRKIVADEIRKRTTSPDRSRKQFKMLNLFSYTGSFSVYAARAGATVTSVDMSPVYLEWSERNFIANGLLTSNHRFINDDVLEWMKEGFGTQTGPYDYIVCDPPTFSNSKKMDGTWEVMRDHRWLIEKCIDALQPDGVLIFSANRRDFKIDTEIAHRLRLNVKEITRDTLPKDFRDAKLRHVYRINKIPKAAEPLNEE